MSGIFYAARNLPNQKKKNGKAYSVTTQLILKVAKEKGMEITSIPDSNIIKLEHEGETRYFFQQIPAQLTSILGQQIVNNKSATKFFLKKVKINTPRGFVLSKTDKEGTWQEVFNELQKPLVIKPISGGHGDGVMIGLKTWADFLQKAKILFKDADEIIVEEMCAGSEYRLTASRSNLMAVTQRIPANVVGDGKRTIMELIDEKNTDRADDTYLGNLVKTKVDDETRELLIDQKVTLKTVPEIGKIIWLKKVSNISMGGDSVDLTSVAHPSVADVAVKAIKAIPGLQFGGIDLICEDIRKPLSEQQWVILEINDSPGFCIAEEPALGEGQEVSAEFLELMFSV